MLARIGRFFHQPWSSPDNRAVLFVQFAVIIAASGLFSLGYVVQREIPTVPGRYEPDAIILGWDGLAWIVWPLAAPAMLVLVRRYPFVRGQIIWSLSRLVIGNIALLAIVVHARFVLRLLPHLWTGGASLANWQEHYLRTTLVLLPIDILTFTGFFSTTLAIDYYFKQRRHQAEKMQLQLRTAKLQSDLAHAELDVLRGQLRPHFLFNSFNAVTTLIRQGRNEAAVEAIAELSLLLRLAMDRPGHQELALEAELEFIRRYLGIEQIRFGDKLQVRFEVQPEATQALVPNFLLQPLVENAIKHGISRRTIAGAVCVTAVRAADRLDLRVVNDGPDPGSSAGPASDGRVGGLGLSITRARLEKTYGPDYRLEMTPRDAGGMCIRLDLPWRTAVPG